MPVSQSPPCASHQADERTGADAGRRRLLQREHHRHAQRRERVEHQRQHPGVGDAAAPTARLTARAAADPCRRAARTRRRARTAGRARDRAPRSRPRDRAARAPGRPPPRPRRRAPARASARRAARPARRSAPTPAPAGRRARGLAGEPRLARDRLREEQGELVGVAVGGAQPEQQRRERQAVQHRLQYPGRRGASGRVGREERQQPADAQSARWTCRKRLSRCSASSRRNAAST